MSEPIVLHDGAGNTLTVYTRTQVHGAIGFTIEHILHRFSRALLTWRDDFGNESQWAVELGSRIAAAGAPGRQPGRARGRGRRGGQTAARRTGHGQADGRQAHDQG